MIIGIWSLYSLEYGVYIPYTPTGHWEAYEVKTTRGDKVGSLSKAQRDMGADAYTRDRLQRAANGSGHYKSLSQNDRDKAERILKEIDAQGGVKGQKKTVFVDANDNVKNVKTGKWNCS